MEASSPEGTKIISGAEWGEDNRINLKHFFFLFSLLSNELLLLFCSLQGKKFILLKSQNKLFFFFFLHQAGKLFHLCFDR